MTRPHFIISDSDHNDIHPLSSCAVNDIYSVPKKTSKHIFGSLRMNDGDELSLGDGQGTKVNAHIFSVHDSTVCVESITTQPAPRVRLGLIQALAKHGRDESAVEESTEIGVDDVIAWQADRSIVQWKGPKQEKALSKWRSLVTAASEQSRREWVPDVQAYTSTPGLIQLMKNMVNTGDMIIVLHQDAVTQWSDIEQKVTQFNNTEIMSSDLRKSNSRTVWVVVGPEGGISDKEISAFREVGVDMAVIGNNILRASTAGPVALTLLSRVLGRFNRAQVVQK